MLIRPVPHTLLREAEHGTTYPRAPAYRLVLPFGGEMFSARSVGLCRRPAATLHRQRNKPSFVHGSALLLVLCGGEIRLDIVLR